MSGSSSEQIIAAGDFKAKCLALMDRVRDEGVEFVITKYGHPVARLVPCEPEREVPILQGMGRGQIIIHGDLTEPTFGDEPVEELRHHSAPNDTADRFIMATALALDAVLVTADREILAWDGPLDCMSAV